MGVSSLEPFTPTREREETFDLWDEETFDLREEVELPSPDLVEALDDCEASLAVWSPDWIRGGVFGDQPLRRGGGWPAVAGKIPFYGLIVALSGLVGWLIDVAVNAVAK